MDRDSADQDGMKTPVKIVSWRGGEHWYIGRTQFLRLEEAIRACEREGVPYEIVEDTNHFYGRNGD